MDQVRPEIEKFAGRMFGGFARRDQQAKGELYLRGLMLDGKRKSMQPMAERLWVDHQQLRQFVTTSTWDQLLLARRHIDQLRRQVFTHILRQSRQADHLRSRPAAQTPNQASRRGSAGTPRTEGQPDL